MITYEKLIKLGKDLGEELLAQCLYCGIISYDEIKYWMIKMGWEKTV